MTLETFCQIAFKKDCIDLHSCLQGMRALTLHIIMFFRFNCFLTMFLLKSQPFIFPRLFRNVTVYFSFWFMAWSCDIAKNKRIGLAFMVRQKLPWNLKKIFWLLVGTGVGACAFSTRKCLCVKFNTLFPIHQWYSC